MVIFAIFKQFFKKLKKKIYKISKDINYYYRYSTEMFIFIFFKSLNFRLKLKYCVQNKYRIYMIYDISNFNILHFFHLVWTILKIVSYIIFYVKYVLKTENGENVQKFYKIITLSYYADIPLYYLLLYYGKNYNTMLRSELFFL